MRVLVTGGAGYVGSALIKRLIDGGHAVRVVDCGFFGVEHVDPRAELIAGNILDFDPAWLGDIDAVVHLAGLSNDPMAAFSPSLNYLTNAAGTAIVAQAAKDSGIRRFVFSSTCSVYGSRDGRILNEDEAVNPPFPYAISKLMAERLLTCLTDERFRPIIFRKGTVVGWSPRMRFDLVINTMVKTAITEGRIVIHHPDLWRPLIDVEDACDAYLRALDADPVITGVFNISSRNYRLEDLGSVVAAEVRSAGLHVTVQTEQRSDVRSYCVDTGKADRVLNFVARTSIEETVRELIAKTMGQPAADLEHPRYYNVRQMELHMSQGSLTSTGHASMLQARLAASAAS